MHVKQAVRPVQTLNEAKHLPKRASVHRQQKNHLGRGRGRSSLRAQLGGQLDAGQQDVDGQIAATSGVGIS